MNTKTWRLARQPVGEYDEWNVIEDADGAPIVKMVAYDGMFADDEVLAQIVEEHNKLWQLIGDK